MEMGIKIGEVISTADGLITCKIAEEKKVEYEGEVMSLTRLTRKLKELDYRGPFIMQAYRDDEGLEVFKQQLSWIKPYLEKL